MRRRRISGLVLAGLVASLAAPAWADDFDCADPKAQQEVNYCLAIANNDIGKSLDAAWQAEVDHEKAIYASDPEALAKVLKALDDSRSAFAGYMASQCTSEGYMAMGGTLEAQLYGECVNRLSAARIAELKALTEGLGN